MKNGHSSFYILSTFTVKINLYLGWRNYKNNSSLEKGQGYAKKIWPQHDLLKR